ncbi:hypothetical protein PT287_09860 [Lactobacillus sp. ESL0679]|uniref:hypothetical protein n=1 Tax=Lactobacillus sp. ESL0679 TaxID=2983209 RepID=UPI0023F780F6|nr:hypothetical protein [Lactobacillus sp. ESL0679]MDF7683803.1 hypothetical protein [Lactobacillus sp. ESL0679]
MVVTEAQKRAKKKYQQKHRKEANVYSYRSTAKNFIKNYATFDDLQELKELISANEKEKSE